MFSISSVKKEYKKHFGVDSNNSRWGYGNHDTYFVNSTNHNYFEIISNQDSYMFRLAMLHGDIQEAFLANDELFLLRTSLNDAHHDHMSLWLGIQDNNNTYNKFIINVDELNKHIGIYASMSEDSYTCKASDIVYLHSDRASKTHILCNDQELKQNICTKLQDNILKGIIHMKTSILDCIKNPAIHRLLEVRVDKITQACMEVCDVK